MTTQANCIMGLYAQTSIHAGTGQNTGAIDLPIQREGHNGYPCIYGSAMKGALRSHAETQHGIDDNIKLAFGPEMSDKGGSDHAGALMIGDARILLLPIRSLTSQFKWVTCPAVLSRYKQDAKRFGIEADFDIPDVPNASGEDEAIALISDKAENPESSLFLEEYRFTAQTHDLQKIITTLSQLMATQSDTEQNLQQQLTIISNDMFSHISEHATPVNAHIAIDSITKTAKSGALWYEETLPPETLLYVGISANASRQKLKEKETRTSAKDILNNLSTLFSEGNKPFLQVGGNETVGMGWCAVKTIKA